MTADDILSSTNSEQPIEFDLNYSGLDVRQGETPNMIIKHTIATKVKRDNLFIKINGIEYEVEVNEILRNNNSENRVVDLGSTYSHFVSFFSSKISTDRSVLIKFPVNKLTKFVKSRLINGKFWFKISCIINYEIYFHQNGHYLLKGIDKRSTPIFINSSVKYRVEPSDDQISTIIEQNKYTSKLMIELPLLEDPSNNQILGSAVENVKLAAKGFIDGNFSSIILNTRNAIENDLTELDSPNSPEKKRILKNEIKESCVSNIPTKDKDDYKEILNNIGSMTAALLRVINKYAHEKQTTIRMRPLHADLELLYYSASLITKYLTTLNNTKYLQD